MSESLFFILGPAGVGKSTLAAALARNYRLLYLELDRERGKPSAADSLKPLWHDFSANGRANGVAQSLRSQAREAGTEGAVLSFPCHLVPGPRLIASALAQGVTLVALYASGAECLQSFVARERLTGRKLGEGHWRRYNAQSYALLSGSLYDPYRLQAFEDGRHRDVATLASEAWAKAGSPERSQSRES
ncbi:MAG TPA: ATP-binding protein [Ramlibacter sp.]|nr:ATP-binding protein [Ramlibacter sp.]